jgi:predicted component of type VI protein secretion system
MVVEFTFLAGRRAGRSVSLAKSYLTIGRHPTSDLRFGPDEDLEVSSRHAAVLLRDGVRLLRDLGSTNGTFVNGARLRGDHVLADGDVLRLGRDGPEVRVRLEAAPAASVPVAGPASGVPTGPAVRVPTAIVPDRGAPLTPRPARPTRPDAATGVPAPIEPRAAQPRRRRRRLGVVAALVALGVLLALAAGAGLRRGTHGGARQHQAATGEAAASRPHS